MKGRPAAGTSITGARTETPSEARLQRARAAYRGYFRWLRLSRLTQAAFIMLAGFFLIWSLPWLPRGLDSDDYTPELAFTVLLVTTVAFVAVLSSAFRELAHRDRESLVLLSEFVDEATGLHARGFLNDRLALECERAERGGEVFSIFVVQIHTGSSSRGQTPELTPEALRKLAELIDREARPRDLVARLSGAELAILAGGIDRASRVPLLESLREAVELALPQLLNGTANAVVRYGAATYGEDGKSPDVLIQNARTDLALAVRRAKAA